MFKKNDIVVLKKDWEFFIKQKKKIILKNQEASVFSEKIERCQGIECVHVLWSGHENPVRVPLEILELRKD